MTSYRDRANDVHDFILNYLKQHQCLPLKRDVAAALELTDGQLYRALMRLRAEGRIADYTLYPHAYTAYWRRNAS